MSSVVGRSTFGRNSLNLTAQQVQWAPVLSPSLLSHPHIRPHAHPRTCPPAACTGYYLKDTTHTTIELCPVGTVSFYTTSGTPSAEDRVPANSETSCIACGNLDGALDVTFWAHTYAPRKGMTQCVPCPGGTVPKTENGATSKCGACPNGHYRDAYTVR